MNLSAVLYHCIENWISNVEQSFIGSIVWGQQKERSGLCDDRLWIVNVRKWRILLHLRRFGLDHLSSQSKCNYQCCSRSKPTRDRLSALRHLWWHLTTAQSFSSSNYLPPPIFFVSYQSVYQTSEFMLSVWEKRLCHLERHNLLEFLFILDTAIQAFFSSLNEMDLL